jgi:hypothetical protein
MRGQVGPHLAREKKDTDACLPNKVKVEQALEPDRRHRSRKRCRGFDRMIVLIAVGWLWNGRGSHHQEAMYLLLRWSPVTASGWIYHRQNSASGDLHRVQK